jgi:predicted CXXCH cytochrome family protein
VQQCAACHAQPDATKHAFDKVPQASELCVRCHQLNLHATVHKPVAEGNCTACHDPHHSQTKALLKQVDERSTCGQCHEQAQATHKKFVHGPVAAGGCTLCHNPHSSYYPKLLDKQGSEVCLKCHTDMEQMLRGAKHWHRPVSENCANCHDASLRGVGPALKEIAARYKGKKVSAEVAKKTGWRDSLEKILSNFEHPSRRLYREPILRKIADRYPVPKSEKENQSCRKLLAKIFENRETASLEEICKCLDVCGSSSLHTKIRVLTSLPSLLISLSREDGQKVLRSMFNLVDKDKKLGISLAESDIFEKIEESLGDDQQSKILLELCLHS